VSDLVIPNTLTPGTPEDVSDVQDNFTAVTTWANGNIDGDNLTTATNQALGLNETGTVRRGKSIIATEQSTTSTSYTTLTTPDRVQNVVLPTDGLIFVALQAMWKESVNAAARAAIFVGSDQLKVAASNTANPAVQEAQCQMAADTYGNLVAYPAGLSGGAAGTVATGYVADVTTGQAVGTAFAAGEAFGFTTIFAAAGTYTISIQFKTSSGTLTAKNRKLWVWTQAFG
jgi:hypothetical protein